MTKLVLSKEKSERLIKKLNDVVNLTVKSVATEGDEVAFLIPKKDEPIFFKILSEILDQINELWFETYDGQIKLYPSNCVYFEVSEQNVVLVTDQDKKVILKTTLQELEKKLGDLEFQRISKSVIVNLKKITYIRPQFNSKIELTIGGKLKLHVNRSYLKEFKKALKEKGGF